MNRNALTPAYRSTLPLIIAILLLCPSMSSAAIALKDIDSDPFEAITVPTTNLEAMAIVEAIQKGDSIEAKELATNLHNQGDPVGTFLLGIIDEELGQFETAEQHYRQALRNGHNPSSLYLARLVLSNGGEARREEGLHLLAAARSNFAEEGEILHGNLILQGAIGQPDFNKAVEAWEKAATTSTKAQILLGRLYNGDLGFPEHTNHEKATQFFRKAARNGSVEAMLLIGYMLATDRATETSPREGYSWLERAASRGELNSMQILAELALEKDNNPAEALKWYVKGSELGHGPCSTGAGMIYDDGKGVDKNPAKALEFYLKASEQGDALGAFNAAMAIIDGYGGEPDPYAAYPHLLLAAGTGMPIAQWEMAKLYFDGYLGPGDAVAATGWLDRAADSGMTEAQFKSGQLALFGVGAPTNIQKAGIRLSAAARNRHPEAAYHVAQMYENGIGTDADPIRAWVFYQLANEFGLESNAEDAERLAANWSKEQRDEAAELLATMLKELDPPPEQ